MTIYIYISYKSINKVTKPSSTTKTLGPGLRTWSPPPVGSVARDPGSVRRRRTAHLQSDGMTIRNWLTVNPTIYI